MSEAETDLPARPARKAPSRPWGWERAFWFHMPQHERRLHYRCCWFPLAAFNREDVEHGSKPNWWLE